MKYKNSIILFNILSNYMKKDGEKKVRRKNKNKYLNGLSGLTQGVDMIARLIISLILARLAIVIRLCWSNLTFLRTNQGPN